MRLSHRNIFSAARRMGRAAVSRRSWRAAGMLAFGLLFGSAGLALAQPQPAPADTVPVGIELNATHHRSATSGLVTGVATPIHVGSRMATFEIVISDDAGRRVCTARLTCLFRPTRGLPTPPPVS